MKTHGDYLMDEKVEDVLVGYAVPQKAGERLRKLQQALHETREEFIKSFGLPVLEGMLLFGSFTRGKPEPDDIDFVPFLDFSQYTPEEDDFRNLMKKSNQIIRLLNAFERHYIENRGAPHLELVNYNPRNYPKRYHIDCTSDHLFAVDYSQLLNFFTEFDFLNPLAAKFGFCPRVEHILGTQSLKDRFKRIAEFD